MKILEWVREKMITLEYVPSADNLADFFTKPAKRAVFISNRDAIMTQVGIAQAHGKVESGLLSYEVGRFAPPGHAKPSVSAVHSSSLSMSAVMATLYHHIKHS